MPQVEINEKLYDKLVLEAQKQKRSMAEVVAAAIQMYFAKKEDKGPKQLRPQV